MFIIASVIVLLETALAAIEIYRHELNVIDQDIPAFVIAKDGEPVAKIIDNDSVILFNFCGDRALELSMAFDNETFKEISYDKVSFDERPWMKSAEITDDLIEAIESGKYVAPTIAAMFGLETPGCWEESMIKKGFSESVF